MAAPAQTASGLKCAGFYRMRIEMKRLFAACALCAALAFMGSVHADEKLAQSSGCMTCHAIDKKVIGPSFKEIAAKYRNDKTAEAALFKKVKAGGKGVWGETPMPPNAHVKDEDIKTLVHWILSLK
jgi:cytochrome c